MGIMKNGFRFSRRWTMRPMNCLHRFVLPGTSRNSSYAWPLAKCGFRSGSLDETRGVWKIRTALREYWWSRYKKRHPRVTEPIIGFGGDGRASLSLSLSGSRPRDHSEEIGLAWGRSGSGKDEGPSCRFDEGAIEPREEAGMLRSPLRWGL